MSKKKEQSISTLHGKPVTRRDFLAAGLIQFSATMAIPTVAGMLLHGRKAYGQDLLCSSGAVSDLCPFITVNLSGGAALSANFVPHDKGKQLLSSYSKMGMGSGANLTLIRDFANQAPFFAGSGFYQGLSQSSTTFVRMMSAFVGVCYRSQDDSSTNKQDLSGLVLKAGAKGTMLPNLGINSQNGTGTKNMHAYIKPSAPLYVRRVEDIRGALQLGGVLSALDPSQQTKMLQAANSMSASQQTKYMQMTAGEMLAQLFGCANQDNTKLISNGGSANIDPMANAAFAAIWGITANTATNNRDYIFGSMVYNALLGNSSTVNLEMGGYDYHNNTRTTGDAADVNAGTVVGRILSSAALLGKKCFIVVMSDGSVTSPESDTAGAPWSSDRGSAGCAYMLAYNPLLAPTAKSFQLGHYTSGQAADDTFLIGGSPEMAAGAIFANYMSFNGKSALIENILPRVFSSTDIDLVTVLG
jgi:hypothetical protein